MTTRYTSVQANYLTIPVYAFATIVVAVVSFLSDRMNTRITLLVLIPIPTILGYSIALGTSNIAAGYVAMFFVGAGMLHFNPLLCSTANILSQGIYIFNAMLLTWVSINLSPDYKRSVGIPIFASLANISGILSSNIYPASDSPRYIIGNAVSLSCEVLAFTGVVAIYFLLKSRNAKKAKLIAEGATDNGMEGDRSLHFKYLL
jgi:hypothetical protein